jgi:hypothetical protein
MQRRKYNFHYGHLSDAVDRALQTLKWNYRKETPYVFVVYRPLSLVSLGENMTISIYDDGTIDVHSINKIQQATYDYGKNQRNIKRFMLQLDRELGLVKDERVEKKKRKKHSFRKRVLGSKTAEPEDGELIER